MKANALKIHRLDHIHIYSHDPEGSVRFYAEVLGADVVGKARTSWRGNMHFVRLGGLALVLAPFPPGAEPGVPSAYHDGANQGGFGIAHFGLHVDKLTDAVESIRRLGGQVLSEPREHAGLRFAYIGAPDGVIIELLEYDGEWAALLGDPRSTERRPESFKSTARPTKD
jgi:catechol 2,3-dioxygenase-like lactoylglutathione lyase family enzyme